MNWSADFYNNITRNFFLMDPVDDNLINFFKSLGITYTSQVLEQCCGEGTLSIALAQSLGCKTLGVDQCLSYIETASKKAKEAQVTSKFMQYDLLSDKCVALTHFVINWHTSWGYFEDDSTNLKFLQNANKHLRSGGTFVLEYYNSDWVINNFKKSTVITKDVDGVTYTCKRESRIENQCLISDFIIKDSSKKNLFEGSGLTKMYTKDEIVSLLCQAGFKDIQCFSDVNKSTDELNGPRLIFVSKK